MCDELRPINRDLSSKIGEIPYGQMTEDEVARLKSDLQDLLARYEELVRVIDFPYDRRSKGKGSCYS